MPASSQGRTEWSVASAPGTAERRLSSWKEIANYFHRDVRTVQLWEQKEGLPVHRHEHSTRASVYAYPDELDQWFAERARKRTTELEPAATEDAALRPSSSRANVRVWMGLAAVFLTAILAVAGWLVWRAVSVQRLPGNGTLAVLPFLNLTGESAQDYLSDGITDELTTLFASQLRLKVVARTSAFQFKGKSADVRSIGNQLNAALILEGSIRTEGDEQRVNVQLIRASDGYHVWSHLYDTSHGDSMAVEEQIVHDIGAALKLPMPASAPASANSLDQQAHRFYLLGDYYWSRRSTDDEWKAIGYFNQAIDREPLYARAYLGLGQAYLLLGANGQAPPGDVFPKAREAAEKALQIDPGLTEADAILAQIRWTYEWNYAAAESEFRRMITVNPNLPTAHHWYGLMLMYQGRFDEARSEFAKAQALDPLNPTFPMLKSRLAFCAGNYKESIRLNEDAVKVNPNFPLPHLALGEAYLYEGNTKAALDEFEKVYELTNHDPQALQNFALAYARMGNRTQAMEYLKRMDDLENNVANGYSTPFVDAGIYAALGEKEQTYLSLQKAIDARSPAVIMMLVDPAFQFIRSEPRFQQMLRVTGHVS